MIAEMLQSRMRFLNSPEYLHWKDSSGSIIMTDGTLQLQMSNLDGPRYLGLERVPRLHLADLEILHLLSSELRYVN